MAFLTELWLPILLSAVFVFIASSIIHMALPIHRNDVKKLPGEDGVLDALRAANVAPGAYMFPCADSMKEMSAPEMKAKMERGPVGWMTVMGPGGFNMGRSLALWFAFSILVGFLTAYVTWHAVDPGTGYLKVFQVAGAVAFMGYAIGYVQDPIWKGARWSTTIKFIVDGFVYALVTAGTFGWLWPGAPAA